MDDPISFGTAFLLFFDYRATFHMVYCHGVLLAIYSIFLLLTQLKRTKIIREIFRAKAIVLIIAMVASIGKRISIQESEGFFQFGPELVYAKVDAALLKWHFAFEPQIYLMYGMVNSLFLCEQMLYSYFLFEIYSCTCKMEARGESKRSLACPIVLAFIIPFMGVSLELILYHNSPYFHTTPRIFAVADLFMLFENAASFAMMCFNAYPVVKILIALKKSDEFHQANAPQAPSKNTFIRVVVITLCVTQIARFTVQLGGMIASYLAYSKFDVCTVEREDVLRCMNSVKPMFKLSGILGNLAWCSIAEFLVILIPAFLRG